MNTITLTSWIRNISWIQIYECPWIERYIIILDTQITNVPVHKKYESPWRKIWKSLEKNMNVPVKKTRSVLAIFPPTPNHFYEEVRCRQEVITIIFSFQPPHQPTGILLFIIVKFSFSGSCIANKKSKNMEHQIQEGFWISKILS